MLNIAVQTAVRDFSGSNPSNKRFHPMHTNGAASIEKKPIYIRDNTRDKKEPKKKENTPLPFSETLTGPNPIIFHPPFLAAS